MEKGDILTLAIGLIIVVVIAVVANPQYLSGLKGIGGMPPSVPTPTPLPVPTVIYTIPVTTVNINPTPTKKPADAPLYRISYSDKPFLYPVYKLPDNLNVYGGSDIVSRSQEMVPFAFVNEKRGGLTQTFSVPYPVWIINTTVIANTTPQYGKFRMALCNAKDGSIIEGEEILNRGTSYRVVQISNTDMYMIISTAYIDGYYIRLEAPRDYYDQYRPK